MYHNIKPIISNETNLFIFQTQFLHCIQQYHMEGGDNEFVDGFYIGQLIRDNYPEEWEALTTSSLDYWDVGTEEVCGNFHKITSLPTFQ